MELSTHIAFLITLNHLCTSARIRSIREHGFGIREIVTFDEPKEFPHVGFQLGMVHIEKNYRGPIYTDHLLF